MEAFQKVDVLEKLVEIFQQTNSSESISGEIALLRQQCAEFIAEERLRRAKPDGDIVVRTCEFSKLQFPKSQTEGSGQNVPVR